MDELNLDKVARELSAIWQEEEMRLRYETKQRRMLEAFCKRHPNDKKAAAMLQRFNERHPA